jgi:hypothetical protein
VLLEERGGYGFFIALFFDITAEENLRIEAIYSLCVGLVTMFEKIAQTHGK